MDELIDKANANFTTALVYRGFILMNQAYVTLAIALSIPLIFWLRHYVEKTEKSEIDLAYVEIAKAINLTKPSWNEVLIIIKARGLTAENGESKLAKRIYLATLSGELEGLLVSKCNAELF